MHPHSQNVKRLHWRLKYLGSSPPQPEWLGAQRGSLGDMGSTNDTQLVGQVGCGGPIQGDRANQTWQHEKLIYG